MSKKVNQPVHYEPILNKLVGKIETGFEDIFSASVTKMERLVSTAHKNFFKRLVIRTIDRRSAPSLGEYTPVWKQLSVDYKNRKRREGHSNNFFVRTGTLKAQLQRQNAKTILGTPLISFVPASFTGVTTSLEKWRGQSSKRLVVRDSRGHFVKEPKKLTAKIIVDPYPKIVEDIRSEIVPEHNYFNKDVADKLKGRGLRPLFTNYLNWYLNTEIKKAVQTAVKL